MRSMRGECRGNVRSTPLPWLMRRTVNGPRPPPPAALAPDDDALEGLDALAAALDHLQMHPHGVAGSEDGDLPFELLALDDRYLVHADILRSPAGVGPPAGN